MPRFANERRTRLQKRNDTGMLHTHTHTERDSHTYIHTNTNAYKSNNCQAVCRPRRNMKVATFFLSRQKIIIIKKRKKKIDDA